MSICRSSCGLQPTRLHCPWDSPSRNTGVGCRFLLQRIFLTQGSNPCLLHWQANSLPLSHQGNLCPLLLLIIYGAHSTCYTKMMSLVTHNNPTSTTIPALQMREMRPRGMSDLFPWWDQDSNPGHLTSPPETMVRFRGRCDQTILVGSLGRMLSILISCYNKSPQIQGLNTEIY